MISVVVANQKGGVGKTASTRHLYFAALERKIRTLVVDLDPQKNASKTILGLADPKVVAVGKWLTSRGMFKQNSLAIPMPVNELSALISADDDLVDVGDFSMKLIIEPRKTLKKFSDQYDLCIIDTPPSKGKLLFAALACADLVLCPCTLDEDAADGLAALFEDIERVRMMGWNPDLQVLGVQVNKMLTKSANDRGALEELKNSLGDLVLNDIMYERAAIRQAIRRPVWQSVRGGENKGAAAREMKAACNAILDRAGL